MYGNSQKLYVIVEALLYIAHYPPMQPLGGKKLSSVLNIPPRYLELWLQSLVRAQILRSTRGPRGGYMLARDKRDIRMDEVLLAFAQPLETMLSTTPATTLQKNVIIPLFAQAEQAYQRILGTMTLEQLCDNVFVQGLASHLTLDRNIMFERLDFSI